MNDCSNYHCSRSCTCLSVFSSEITRSFIVYKEMDVSQLRSKLVVALATQGCTTREIQAFLQDECDQSLSLRHIQRILKCGRRQEEDRLECVHQAIEAELQGSGRQLGYRGMWYRLKNKYGIKVKRDTVMMLLALLDPENTKHRQARKLKRRVYRSKGPNYSWHCDGHDKLKPFGLPIHGCIDGYSRKILWLELASSNNNPRYIAAYYCKCVRGIGGCPVILRTDLGTENSSIAIIQPVLRHYHTDSFAGEKSHWYGKSTANQRIEALWCQLRSHLLEWWISFFKDMECEGQFNAVLPYHIDAVRFSFGPLIQKELNQFVIDWNSHRIRHTNMTEVPSGIPNVLYTVPSLKGTQDFKCQVYYQTLCELENEYCAEPHIVCSEFRRLAEAILDENNLNSPVTFLQALEVYFLLTHSIEAAMEH